MSLDLDSSEITVYKVKPGDSLLRIAYTFNMNLQMLKKLNGLVGDEIFQGQMLKIIDHRE